MSALGKLIALHIPDLWRQWLELNNGDAQAALETLGDPRKLPSRAAYAAEIGGKYVLGSGRAEARNQMRAAEALRDEIIARFLAIWREGAFALFYLMPATGRMMKLPPELATSVAFDFARDTARVGGLEFVGITVREPARAHARSSAPRIKDYLAQFPKESPPPLAFDELWAKAKAEGNAFSRQPFRDACGLRWPSAEPGQRPKNRAIAPK